jgi:ribonuclease HI
MTEWVRAWKARGWRRKGGPPENLELWQELDRIARDHRLVWSWVRGHAGDPRNEYANHLAVRAARTLGDSGGLVPSGFSVWLERERDARDRFTDFFEDLPPSG